MDDEVKRPLRSRPVYWKGPELQVALPEGHYLLSDLGRVMDTIACRECRMTWPNKNLAPILLCTCGKVTEHGTQGTQEGIADGDRPALAG